MSDYRFEIVEHHDIPCLHVMIDSEPIAEARIPLDAIQEAMAQTYVQLVIKSFKRFFEVSPLTGEITPFIEEAGE